MRAVSWINLIKILVLNVARISPPLAAKALADGRLARSIAELSDDELVALCDFGFVHVAPLVTRNS